MDLEDIYGQSVHLNLYDISRLAAPLFLSLPVVFPRLLATRFSG